MHIACLPHGSPSSSLRQVLAGASDTRAIVLPSSPRHRDGGEWLLDAMRELRRELFLEPELQVFASVDPAAVRKVTREVARLLAESRLDEVTIGRVQSSATATTIVEWLAGGETFAHAETGDELDDDVLLETAYIELGAAPLVDASESSARIVISTEMAPGSLALAAAYERLELDAHDWNRLATLVTLARVVEEPRKAAPLWMEVSDGGEVVVATLPTIGIDTLDEALDYQRRELSSGRVNPDVGVELDGAGWEMIAANKYTLGGALGHPPTGRYAVELRYRETDSDTLHDWPTTISKTLVDWDASVRPARRWLGRKR
jgi:hypothetical protein